MTSLLAASSGWTIGLVLGIVVILVAAAIVITIVRLERAQVLGLDRFQGAGERGEALG